jgi:hypothetical protein
MTLMFNRFSRHGSPVGHFKALLLVLIAAVASVAGVYAYIRSQPVQTGPSATIISLPLEFSVSLNKGTFQLGENFTIQFLLKNVGNQTVALTKPSMGGFPYKGVLDTEVEGATVGHYVNACHFAFTIKASNGTLVLQMGPGAFAAIYVISIEPGGYLKQTLHWNYYYQIGLGIPFPKGTYQLTGQFNAGMGESYNNINLETSPITFIID